MQCHNANVIDLLTKFTDILVIFVNGLSYTWTDLGWYVKHGGRQAPRCYTRSFLRKFYSVPSRFRISFLIVVPPPDYSSPLSLLCHQPLMLVHTIYGYIEYKLLMMGHHKVNKISDNSRRIA